MTALEAKQDDYKITDGDGIFADEEYRKHYIELTLQVKKQYEEYAKYSLPYKLYCYTCEQVKNLWFNWVVFYTSPDAFWERVRIAELAQFLVTTTPPPMFRQPKIRQMH